LTMSISPSPAASSSAVVPVLGQRSGSAPASSRHFVVLKCWFFTAASKGVSLDDQMFTSILSGS